MSIHPVQHGRLRDPGRGQAPPVEPVGVRPDFGELLNATGMVKASPVQRTFVWRVVGIAASLLVLFGILTVQLARLTVLGGDGYQREARSRLYRETFLPTSRGRILDSKGRVLARNTSSLELRIEYSLLSGEWVAQHARKTAYSAHARSWQSLGPDEREVLTRPYVRALQRHVDAVWDRLASICGTSADDLRSNASAVVERVGQMRRRHVDARIASEIAQIRSLGREPTEQERVRIERTNATRRIAEQDMPHQIVRHLPDQIGFDLIRMLDEPVVLPVVFDDGTSGEMEAPALPGVVVAESRDREYPFETVTVELDRTTLPHAVYQRGQPATATITVRGVDTLLTGSMRTHIYDIDIDRRNAAIASDAGLEARAMASVDRSSIAGFGPATPRDLGAYRENDFVGARGVEYGAESELRGTRGLRIVKLGTHEATEVGPKAGLDVQLTIDIVLQARVAAVLDPAFGLCKVQQWHYQGTAKPVQPIGTPLNAAAVVMEVDTGRVIAMVSTPSMTRQTIAENYDTLRDDTINTPLVNRAFQKMYAPGSIVKPLILCAAHTLGASVPNEHITCTGHLFPSSPAKFRCWIYKMSPGRTHSDPSYFGGPLSGSDALEVSCNIYFYTLGRRLGADGIVRAFDMFGVGPDHPLDFGLGHEFVPDPSTRTRGAKIDQTDATFMGIGQGPIEWTPVHAASAYCTLARGGVFIPPTIRMDASPQVTNLGIRSVSIEEALEGLDRSVRGLHGTGRRIDTVTGEQVLNVSGVRVWGKTGTADAPFVTVEPDPDGVEGSGRAMIQEYGDHAWYVVLAGSNKGTRSRPEYAVAVVVDHGGSGGRVAGPVVNQILHALVVEGYIEPGESLEPGPTIQPPPGQVPRQNQPSGPNRQLSMQDADRDW